MACNHWFLLSIRVLFKHGSSQFLGYPAVTTVTTTLRIIIVIVNRLRASACAEREITVKV